MVVDDTGSDNARLHMAIVCLFAANVLIPVCSHFATGVYRLIVIKNTNKQNSTMGSLPPLINAHVGAAREPGIDDENTPKRSRPTEPFAQGRIIVQPQSFAKPVHGVFVPHFPYRMLHMVRMVVMMLGLMLGLMLVRALLLEAFTADAGRMLVMLVSLLPGRR